MANLTRMNTMFQKGAVEIILDLFKGLSHTKACYDILLYFCGNHIKPA